MKWYKSLQEPTDPFTPIPRSSNSIASSSNSFGVTNRSLQSGASSSSATQLACNSPAIPIASGSAGYDYSDNFPDHTGYKPLHGINETGSGKQYTCNKKGESITVSKEFLEHHLGGFLLQVGTAMTPTEFGAKFMSNIANEDEAKRIIQMFLYGNQDATLVRTHRNQPTPPLNLALTVVSLLVYLTYVMFGP